MSPTPPRFLLALAALPLAACWNQEQHRDPEKVEVVEEMAAHHLQAVAMRDAVVAGDLEAVHTAAQDLRGRLPITALPDDAKYDELMLRDAVARAAHARDMDAAAQATAEITVACGTCHQARGVTFHQPVPPKPVAADGVAGEMARHHWAATRMWQGLLVPDKTAFEEAAAVLGGSDLAPSGTPVDSQLPPATVELEVRVHDLVAQAARSDDPARRGAAYAAMLATCASCHSVSGKGPGDGTPPGDAGPDDAAPAAGSPPADAAPAEGSPPAE